MDFILNEESLNGQFSDANEFLKSLINNIRCFQIIQKDRENKIYKIRDIYKRRVTGDVALNNIIAERCADELLYTTIQFVNNQFYPSPYWDDESEMQQDIQKQYLCNGKDVTATGIAEAAARDRILL